MAMGAMKERRSPRKWERPRLTKIADSMTAMRMTGREMLLVTIKMMTKMAMMETVLTVAKSLEVTSMRSSVRPASPTRRAWSS